MPFLLLVCEDRSIEFWFNIFDLDVSTLTFAGKKQPVLGMARAPLKIQQFQGRWRGARSRAV